MFFRLCSIVRVELDEVGVDCLLFVFKQKTAYDVHISDWGSDVCCADLITISRASARSQTSQNARPASVAVTVPPAVNRSPAYTLSTKRESIFSIRLPGKAAASMFIT